MARARPPRPNGALGIRSLCQAGLPNTGPRGGCGCALQNRRVLSYTIDMALTWSDSADKHGVAREDALHAIANAVYVETEFDDPRPPHNLRPHLYIGPPRRPGGPLLEVMVEVRPPRGLHIFHVMEARPKHLARMNPEEGDGD